MQNNREFEKYALHKRNKTQISRNSESIFAVAKRAFGDCKAHRHNFRTAMQAAQPALVY